MQIYKLFLNKMQNLRKNLKICYWQMGVVVFSYVFCCHSYSKFAVIRLSVCCSVLYFHRLKQYRKRVLSV